MTYDELEQAILEVKGRTDQPFGVNLRADAGDAPDRVRPADQARREGRVVRARAEAGADRQAQGPRHRGDAVASAPPGTPRRSPRWGADAVMVQGGEGGGHTGPVPTTLLLPTGARRRRHPGRRGRRLLRRPRPRRRAVVRRRRRSAWAPGSCSPRTARCRTRSSSSTSSHGLDGTVVTDKVDGMPHRMLRTELVEELEEQQPASSGWARRCGARWSSSATAGMSLARARSSDGRAMKKAQGRTLAQMTLAANTPMMLKAGLVEGDTDAGVLACGPGGRRDRRPADAARSSSTGSSRARSSELRRASSYVV